MSKFNDTLKQQIHQRGGEIALAAIQAANLPLEQCGNGKIKTAIRPERTPSCSVFLEPGNGYPAGTWNDFGGTKGDIFDFVGVVFGLDDFPSRLKKCAELAGLEVPTRQNSGHNGTSSNGASAKKRKSSGTTAAIAAPKPTKEEFQALLDHYGLAWEDFTAHGCTAVEESFPIGGDWVNHWSIRYPLEKADGSTTFNGGNPAKYRTIARINKGKREAIHEKKRKGHKQNPGTGFFPIGQIDECAKTPGTPLVYTAGEEKALAAIKAGFCAVSWSAGEKSPGKPAVLKIKERLPDCPKIIIAMDNDSAGISGANEAAKDFQQAGFTVAVVRWPKTATEKYDLNDLLKSGGPAALRKFLEEAPVEPSSLLVAAEILSERQGYNSDKNGNIYHWKVIGSGDNEVIENSLVCNAVPVITGEIHEFDDEARRELLTARVIDLYSTPLGKNEAVKVASDVEILKDNWDDTRQLKAAINGVFPLVRFPLGSLSTDGFDSIAKRIAERHKPRKIRRIDVGFNAREGGFILNGGLKIPAGNEPLTRFYQWLQGDESSVAIDANRENNGGYEVKSKRSHTLDTTKSPHEVRIIANTLLENWPKMFPQSTEGRVHAAALLAFALSGPYLPELLGRTNKRLILALVGLSGSGKTERARVLAALWGFTEIEDGAGSQHSTWRQIIEYAQNHRHNLLVVEDARKAGDLGQPISILFDGGQRKKLKQNGEEMPSAPCHCGTLLTAESLDDGQESTTNRILQIPSNKFPPGGKQDVVAQAALDAIEPLKNATETPQGFGTTPLSSVTAASIACNVGFPREYIREVHQGIRRQARDIGQSEFVGFESRSLDIVAVAALAYHLMKVEFLGALFSIEQSNDEADFMDWLPPMDDFIRVLLKECHSKVLSRKPWAIFMDYFQSALAGGRLMGISSRLKGKTSIQEDESRFEVRVPICWRLKDVGEDEKPAYAVGLTELINALNIPGNGRDKMTAATLKASLGEAGIIVGEENFRIHRFHEKYDGTQTRLTIIRFNHD